MEYAYRDLQDGIRICYRIDPERSFPGDDFIIAETWEWNVYLAPEWNIGHDATVVDIGAHIGAFTLFGAAKAPAGRVYAYEPFPDNFKLLTQNLSMNGLTHVVAVMEAVGGGPGVRLLYTDPRSHSGHSFYKRTTGSIEVNVITLCQLFERHAIEECDLLKLDCEGAEAEIVLNTPLELLRRVRRIALEYHLKLLGEYALLQILQRLELADLSVVFYNREKPYLPILLERQQPEA